MEVLKLYDKPQISVHDISHWFVLYLVLYIEDATNLNLVRYYYLFTEIEIAQPIQLLLGKLRRKIKVSFLHLHFL